ncbi:MAG: hypothetical protein AAFP77_18905 [Bacteroidota bacterium]
MDQKKTQNRKQLPQALNQAELRQVKGGYREMVGVSAGSQFVRWDEVDIRFNDQAGGLQGLIQGGGSTMTRSLRISKERR